MAGRNSLIVKLPYSSPSASAINRATGATLSKDPRATASARSSKQEMPAKITTHFTPSQLALALAIQKAKPEAFSTDEYCQQLRNSIKAGQPISSDRLRYIDTCEFWKDQYTKIYSEKNSLQDEVHRLEEAYRQLLGSLNGQANYALLDSSSRKLASGPEINGRIGNEASRKRPALIQEDMAEGQEHGDTGFSSLDDSFLRMSSYVLRIGRQRSNLEKAAKDSSTLGHINILVKYILQSLSLLENALSNTCLPLRLLKTDCEDQRSSLMIQQVMNQVSLSFLSCFKAMSHLSLTIPGRARVPEIVYRMVNFFSKSLNLLHKLSNLQAENEAAQDSRRPQPKRSRTEEREYIVNKSLANSVASIVYGLEWKVQQPGHADLLEGMLFCTLEHTGRLVSEAVFAEHVVTSDNPGNIMKNDDPLARGRVKLESRYLVRILEAALGGPTRKGLIARVLAAEKPSSNDQAHLGGSVLASALTGDLLSRTKKLLQSTLVKSAVGGPNLETLRFPTPPIEDLEPQAEIGDEVENYGSEWLIESVWGIIGWDIIA